ncbi:MAG TPA: PKD domain-containing protein [Chitinophagaceae bacterium]|nr:PKD domain-containing protein [Chitinophagaceae bacterium]
MSRARFHYIVIAILSGIIIISCKKERSCQTCLAKKPPVANAGPDQTISLPTDSVLLNGSASGDPDGTITSYSWKKLNGPASYNINSATTATTLVKNLITGNYEFELTVTDNDGLSDKDSVMIRVFNSTQANRPPVANAGPNQTITQPLNTATLDGSASTDPDNNIVAYSWTKILGPASFTIQNPNLVITDVTNLTQGIYQFELKVTDTLGLFSLDTMEIKVIAGNLPPVANAGPDISVNYDLQTCSTVPASVTLDGRASFDPDGTILSYSWTVQSFTGHSNIVSPNNSVTLVTGIYPGSYIVFVLKVTDNNGASDTAKVLIHAISMMNRPKVNAHLVPVGTLSQLRDRIAVGAAANKIVYAGGQVLSTYQSSSRVDIYDISTQTWTTAELSEARFGIAVASLGNKIFFGGGNKDFGNFSSRVDIYDAVANTWSTAELSMNRMLLTAATVNNKVLFAGGAHSETVPGGWYWTGTSFYSDRVDIYDGGTDTWSIASLSENYRLGMSAVTLGNQVYFAGGTGEIIYSSGWDGGGHTSRIDIYNAAGNTWSTAELSEPKAYLAGIADGNKIYWAGGITAEYRPTNLVETLTTGVGLSTPYSCLFQSNAVGSNGADYLSFEAVLKDNKIVFLPGGSAESKDNFDIYNVATNIWSIGMLNQTLSGCAAISHNNTIYIAGGYQNYSLSNQVWKLEF